jgi:hypothetical protein
MKTGAVVVQFHFLTLWSTEPALSRPKGALA